MTERQALTPVYRARGESFFHACLTEMSKTDRTVWQKFGKAKQIDVAPEIVARARQRLARLGGEKAAAPAVVARDVVLPKPGGAVSVRGIAANDASALVVHRAQPDFECNEWVITHAASGRLAEYFGRGSKADALARAVAIEAACPAVMALDLAKPETVAAFKAEYQKFKGEGSK